MCGITGFYTKKANHSRSGSHMIGKAMSDMLHHRGPDCGDLWQDPDIPLLLGHRRLSILDLSPEGAQPMHSPCGRYILTYNGEIYNFLSLKKELENNGANFRGRSDTEVLLAAITHWGLNRSLQKINGMFAFALWDRKTRELHFARDRLGKKPLYIGWAEKTLLFGSELKALHAHPDFKPQINQETLGLYMRYSCVPAPHCIYENVWSLPAGFRLSLNLETLEAGSDLEAQMAPYWHHLHALEEARDKGIGRKKSDAQMVEEFEDLLTTCVEERMVSDVPLGAFLSGGLDSSAITALMQKLSPRPVQTFTIGFEEADFDEASYALQIAQHLGTHHHALTLKPDDALEIIPQLADIYDEPFADISAIPTALVSKFARRHVTVALSGDGGDEMLGGYNRHIAGPKIYNNMRLLPRPFRRAIAKIMNATPQERWDALAPNHPQFGSHMHKMASILPLRSQEEIYERLISQWTEPLVDDAYQCKTFLNKDTWHPSQNLSFAEKMMYWDVLSYLPNDILTKIDRASMAHSLEVRAPLLDKRIYDYTWSLPLNAKIRDGQGKWLLRQVLARHVPLELFERPKQGFSMPVGSWLRGELQDWAEDLLSKEKLQNHGLLDPAPIRKIWKDHKQGHGNHSGALWNVLMFQSWKARWI